MVSDKLRKQTASFSGHRQISLDDIPELNRRLDRTLAALADHGVKYYGSGGARGFDLIAAGAVLRLRAVKPAVKLIMVLPCRDQSVKWHEEDKRSYIKTLEAADKVVYISENYYDGVMEARNRRLIENSSVCVVYLKHGRSGTSQTVRLAHERGLEIINLAEIQTTGGSD